MILKIKQKHNQSPNYCCKLTGETKLIATTSANEMKFNTFELIKILRS